MQHKFVINFHAEIVSQVFSQRLSPIASTQKVLSVAKSGVDPSFFDAIPLKADDGYEKVAWNGDQVDFRL